MRLPPRILSEATQKMTSVLGIDAAWTSREPSGVALIRKNPDDRWWEYVAVAPSYDAFTALTQDDNVDWHQRPAPGTPRAEQLLAAASELLGRERVAVVAVDMPVSNTPITGRRMSDDEISQRFGANGCGTHSPTRDRPGEISVTLKDSLCCHGYRLAVNCSKEVDRVNSVIEVYPHPALLNLLGRDYRVPYKVSRSNRYWPKTAKHERSCWLVAEFRCIYEALTQEIRGIPDFLPEIPYEGTLTFLKRYEDALDALVCAWVGARYLDGRAEPYGDCSAAIWVPRN